MALSSISNPTLLSPNAKQVASLNNYISTINVRDVDETVFARYGDQGITGLLEMMGAKKECVSGTFEHYEEALLHDSVTLAADTISAKTGTVTIDGVLAKDSAVRGGSILRNAAGLTLYVESVTDGTSGQAGNIQLVVHNYANANIGAAGGAYAIVGNEFSENTGQPDPLSPQVTQYTNSTMIIKESFQVSGSEASNIAYVKVNSPELGSGYM